MKHILAADKIAISLSTLCAIHCVILSAFLIMVPTLTAAYLGDEQFHFFLLFAVIPTSLFSLTLGCKHHRNSKVLLLGFIGISILTITQITGHDILGELGEKIFTLVGSSFTVLGHYLNHRLCRKKDCQKCPGAQSPLFKR